MGNLIKKPMHPTQLVISTDVHVDSDDEWDEWLAMRERTHSYKKYIKSDISCRASSSVCVCVRMLHD